MSNRLIVIVAIVLVVIAGSAYFLTKNSSTTLPAATPTPTPTPTQAMMDMTETPSASPSEAMQSTPGVKGVMDESGNVKEITVTGANFKFNPATITVKKGDTVKLTFKSSGGFHDFVIDEFDVKTKIVADGQQDVVEFTADKVGTYEYYCSVGNHRQMGMVGKIIVQ
jgi:plastocyanin